MKWETGFLPLVVAGMVAATFISRYPVLFLAGRFGLPPRVMEALRYVPPAVLIAIILPSVLIQDDSLSLTLRNEYLVAALITAAAAWRTQRLLVAIVAGMTSLWLWRALLLLAGA